MQIQTRYVDGYLLIVKKENKDAYTKMAAEAAQIWLKYGALAVRECRGDDMAPNMGGESVPGFLPLFQTQPDEEVWFSYIEYASKEDRDRVNAAVHKEMAEKYTDADHATMPFDMSRMAFGGFVVEVGEEKREV